MNKIPEFQKNDRYKRSSYRAYNGKMPAIYDSCIWLKLGRIDFLDEAVLREISRDDFSIRILDVGCGTGGNIAGGVLSLPELPQSVQSGDDDSF